MQKILITGSEGALGFYLKRALMQRNGCVDLTLFCLTRKAPQALADNNIQYVEADFLDGAVMNRVLSDLKPDRIFHFAWETTHGSYWNDPVNRLWANATIELAEQFVNQGGTYFCFAGTCAEYSWNGQPCVEQDAEGDPATLYGREKLRTTKELMSLNQKTATNFSSGRLFFPFSERENENRVTSLLIRKLANDEPLHLRSGDVWRSICHTRHIAQTMVNLANAEAAGVYNIVPKEPMHLGRFLAAIARKMGKENLLSWDDWQAGENGGGEPQMLIGSGDAVASYFPPSVAHEKDIDTFVAAALERFG